MNFNGPNEIGLRSLRRSYWSKSEAKKAGLIVVRVIKATEVQGLMRYTGDLIATTKEYAELLVDRKDCEYI